MPGYARPTSILPSTYVITQPTGNISATDLQGALTEIDIEKGKAVPLQSSAPLSPVASDLWVDNTVPTAPQLKVYSGTSWISIGSATDSDQNIIASMVFS